MICNISLSTYLHQLRQLRHMRLVKTRKDGQHVYYSLDDVHIMQLFNQCMEHVGEKLDIFSTYGNWRLTACWGRLPQPSFIIWGPFW